MTVDRDAFDPALDALLRAHSDETPPTEVDAAILSAAHRAVASAPRNANDGAGSRPWRRWLPLAAAATIAAIAFGVLQVAPTDTRVASPDVGDTPRSATFAPDGRDARDAAAAANGGSSSEKTVQPAAPLASASQPETAGALTGSLRADQADSVAPRSVAEWIARIRALRDEGKPAEAARTLAQFRAAYADADSRLPADLRAWAGTITR